MNDFLVSPIKVSIVRPSGQLSKTVCFVGNVGNIKHNDNTKLKEFYGKNYRAKLAVGDPNSDKFADRHSTVVLYEHDIALFPEDSFGDFREKMSIALGIPTYRQHIFYFDQEQLKTTYTTRLNNMYYNPNILKWKKGSQVQNIYVNQRYIKSTLTIDPLDHIKTLGTETIDNSHVFICDLNDFMGVEIAPILKDKYQFDLVYDGFIMQFWPQFSRDAFRDYLMDEDSLSDTYPSFAKNKVVLKSQYEEEKRILEYNYKHASQIVSWANGSMQSRVVRAILHVSTALVQLNIRNIFDFLRIDDKIIEVRAKVVHNNREYILRKTGLSNDISFPTDYLFSQDIVVALGVDNKHIFVSVRSNGRISVVGTWDELEEIDVNRALLILLNEANYVIQKINELHRVAFIRGTSITKATREIAELSDVETIILWKKSISNLSFARLVKKFENLHESGILVIKESLKTDQETEYLLHKGAHNFSIANIRQILDRIDVNSSNLYIHYSNSSANKKWIYYAGGRPLQIKHRASSVAFNIISVGQDEFDVFFRIISGFLYNLLKTTQFDDNIVGLSSSHFYKSYKLRQEDPDLYNIKRFGSDMVYARLCQQHKQPIIYNEREVKTLSKKDTANLVKYWNFTEKKPAYYLCPNKKYPKMSFVTGKHPLGYCLPCCSKKTVGNTAIKKSDKFAQCLTDHKYNDEDKDVRQHIMDFGKNINEKRLSRVPLVCEKLLYNRAEAELYVFGVKQSIGSIKCGAFHAMCVVANIAERDMIMRIRDLLKNDRLFGTLLGGSIIAHFANTRDLDSSINNIFILGRPVMKNFTHWNELMLELSTLSIGITVYIFTVSVVNETYTVNLTKSRETNTDKIAILIITPDGNYYPIFDINKIEYFQTESIISRNYSNNNRIAIRLRELFVERTDDLRKKWNITAQYVNKSGFCYARIYSRGTDKVYMSVNYEIPKHNIPQFYDIFEPTGFTISAVIDFLKPEKANEYITCDRSGINNIIAVSSKFGMHYVDDISGEIPDLPKRDLGFDPIEVNRAILANAQPTNDHQKILTSALHTNYQYRMFVAEFANYIDSERNLELRKKIYSAIKSADFSRPIGDLTKSIKAMMGDNDDLVAITNTLFSHYYRKANKDTIIDQLKNNVYNFDKTTLNKLLNMPKNEIISSLRDITSEFAVEGVIKDEPFANVYTSCSVQSGASCEKNKLIVNNLNEMNEFLANELSDHLKRKYFLNNIWVENMIDYFDFTQSANENINIYQITKK